VASLGRSIDAAVVPSPLPKPPGYYSQSRAELISDLPRPLGNVLDVGCGKGGAAEPLRKAGASSITGIEPNHDAAVRARLVYDDVVIARAEDSIGRLVGPFETILCYDVLEHLADPASLLMALRKKAAQDAHLHVSIPNARHYSLVRDLVVRGTFGYTEAGHRDSTHLRWFTRRDIVAIVDSAGWSEVSTWHPGARRSIVHRLTRGRLAEFTFVQWVVLARAN
jgi:SAM-dependent methyltransferase